MLVLHVTQGNSPPPPETPSVKHVVHVKHLPKVPAFAFNVTRESTWKTKNVRVVVQGSFRRRDLQHVNKLSRGGTFHQARTPLLGAPLGNIPLK